MPRGVKGSGKSAKNTHGILKDLQLKVYLAETTEHVIEHAKDILRAALGIGTVPEKVSKPGRKPRKAGASKPGPKPGASRKSKPKAKSKPGRKPKKAALDKTEE